MFETYTTVIGTVISDPRRRRTVAGEEVISFRVACNSRRHDKQNNVWSDGPTLYLTISCWRRLIAGVGLAIAKGRPVIAHGQIKTNEYVASDGTKRQDLEMSAASVGLDLSRCVVTYRGTPVYEPSVQPAPVAEENSSPAAVVGAGSADGLDQGAAA
ncbi:single-stranded DNA-binding protein [Gordonia effusa NBRC 100432]|uniref:Single-stranded DNA-binding protein n=1 Tax=Gordonia effusa NBRC 100432 TaxID=1077974 RepID=H0QYY8_9ACTN|nr:single-stranded DNA-binding protein [Gordonia effusa]GAB18039.1 single-stranded DNA-binding protein [Gordonia effusa NBRC 100432]